MDYSRLNLAKSQTSIELTRIADIRQVTDTQPCKVYCWLWYSIHGAQLRNPSE